MKRILPPPLSLGVPVSTLTLLRQSSGSYTGSLLSAMVDSDSMKYESAKLELFLSAAKDKPL